MAQKVSESQGGGDLDLARTATARDGSAFDGLYRVHTDAAWRAAERPLMGVSVGLLGLGIIALGILGHPNGGLAGATPHQLAGPPIGSRPVILAENQAAAQPAAPALPLALAGLPTAITTGTPGQTTGPGGNSGLGGSPTPGAPGGGSSPAPGTVPPVAPTLQLSSQIDLAPAPALVRLGAGQGTGSSTGAAATTPATSQSAGSPPPSNPPSSSSTPSASVSSTAPGTGTTSTTVPAAQGSSAEVSGTGNISIRLP